MGCILRMDRAVSAGQRRLADRFGVSGVGVAGREQRDWLRGNGSALHAWRFDD